MTLCVVWIMDRGAVLARADFDRAIAITRHLRAGKGDEPTLAEILWHSGVARFEGHDLVGALADLEEAYGIAERTMLPERKLRMDIHEAVTKCRAAAGATR